MQKIKLISDAEMSEVLRNRHNGRRTDEAAIYRLVDDEMTMVDNPYLYKNRVQKIEEDGKTKLSIVLDSRVLMDLDRGYVGHEQIQTYEFELLNGRGIPQFIGTGIVNRADFVKDFTEIMSPESVKVCLELISGVKSESKEYTFSF